MNDHPHTHDDGLSPAARTALAALRAEDELAAAVRDRMWSRLAAAAESDGLSDMSQVTAPKDQARRRGLLVGLAIAAALTLTLLAAQRAAQPVATATRGEAAPYAGPGATERAARAAASGAQTEAPRPAPVAAVPEDMSLTAARDDQPQPGAPPRRRAVERAPVPGDMPERPSDSAATDASASALAAEAALLQRAQTALAAEQAEAALQLLEQHAREYPTGVLSPERAALRVVALCAAGRAIEGRAEAVVFLRANAGSVLAGRVRGACGED